MKLYYSPAACSLAPHIALREAGLTFGLEKVDLKTKKTAADADYLRVNPKGYVPALQFDDGTTLTEVTAILQWIADQVPDKHLAPAAGTMERYHLIEWLNFIATEVHRNMGALFKPELPEATHTWLADTLTRRLDYVQQQLGGKLHLMGEHFSVADAYLFVVLSWARWVKFDLTPWPKLGELAARVAARPAVQAALKAEGLVK
jgi:glutathione S-transferase